ncbi:ABC transporter ATP-binding protein [Pseudomonas entomophila]|uniref:ABC transporter ATP-binding protein n=1 Tax=Pseudomonas entomophila TaxID=312306 RepID=UPI0023D8016E|nr:ABC transporter ATP-binding protein [Pseudomonas entomophila]MDF0732208.1 ABC transporter ATP-binding protein [Pseudomonas entomophila]
MIAPLIHAGERLAGNRDPRLTQGLRLAALEGALAAAFALPLYLLLRGLLDGTSGLGQVLWLALAMLVCLLARIAAGAASMPMIFTGAYAMMASARLRLIDHLQSLPLGWFGQHHSGEISARLTSDLELVENLWSHFLGSCAQSLAHLLCLLALLFWVEPLLATTVLLMLPLAGLAVAVAIRKSLVQGERMLACSNQAQVALQEYLKGLAVIRGFGRFGTALRHLEQAIDRQHRAMVDIELKPAPWLALAGLVIEAGYVLMVLAGVLLLGHGQLALHDVLLFCVLALPLYRVAAELCFSTLLLRFGHLALSRTERLLETSPLGEPETAKRPTRHDVEVRDVHFRHGQRGEATLNGVSCTLPAGSLTALVGPSGAGKTTLAHLIARLWDVDSGAIRIGGVDVREIGSQYLCEQVSMVFQDVTLFSGSVLDNLRIGKPGATEQEVIHAARQAQAHAFISALPQGYASDIGEGGGWLSGGERQRLAIARALLKDSQILLLDEATSSVDPSSAAAIQQALDTLVRERTVLVIAHHLHSIQDADQILVMDRGRIVERGRHQQLLELNGLYARLWHQQRQALDWPLHT